MFEEIDNVEVDDEFKSLQNIISQINETNVNEVSEKIINILNNNEGTFNKDVKIA